MDLQKFYSEDRIILTPKVKIRGGYRGGTVHKICAPPPCSEVCIRPWTKNYLKKMFTFRWSVRNLETGDQIQVTLGGNAFRVKIILKCLNCLKFLKTK